MQFADTDGLWRPIPAWVDFLITYGFRFARAAGTARRVSILSLPCDSPGAGLVALGAMRWRLGLEHADDLQAHLQRLTRLASAEVPGIALRHSSHRGRFLLSGMDPSGTMWAEEDLSSKPATSKRRAPLRKAILPNLVADWTFDGEAPVVVVEGTTPSFAFVYGALLGEAPPVRPSNLCRSDSGVCLAGRATGEVQTHNTIKAARFRMGDEETDLSHALSVHAWSPAGVSRMTFLNTRTQQFDRNNGAPAVVVVDGDAAFMKAIELEHFRHSDIVAVIHRAIDRDRLEAVGVKIADLGQWYTKDVELLSALPRLPRGITVSALRQRR